MSATPTLKKALSQRQLTMIAIGGVIGAGLFVGSGVVIGATGPGAFLTYGMAGVLIIMVMRMLAEMAVANPSTGSFADYSRNALGHWAGFSVGWLYWYFWVIVVGFEAIAGAKIIQYWIDVPLWLSALVFMVLMTSTNLFSVSSYGEFEFWFAGIKVAAIIAFIALGGAYVFGLWPGKSTDFSNLTSHGGFMPLGFGAITVGIVTVIFSMVGAEIATIAAAESADPERAVAKAANSVILRILIFYVGAVLLLVTILPWNDKGVAASPFVAAFTKMGIPYADHVMNVVVLTAVLSCLNSGMYTASRMLFVLAARREAPPALVKVTRRGVPTNAILASSVVGFLCVIAAAVSPDTIFAFLLNSSGAIILFVYLLIAISQIVLRYRTPDSELRVKMWLFPVLSALTALAIVAILVQMYLDTSLRSQLVLSLLSWAVVIVLFVINKWFVKRRSAEPAEVSPTGTPHRVLVLANQTVDSRELLDELRRIGAGREAQYMVVVPASPVDTGAAETHGPRDVTEATQEAATARLDTTLAALRHENLDAQGELGDYRPLRALDHAVAKFSPDQIVIATLPAEFSVWHRFDVVDRARAQFNVPVTHVVAQSAVRNEVPR
ncbi:gamma-aminobutyrate permease-like transporter [Mycolicibacterium chubuense NBB4]|uniref:Gamma-aminobutyrate permease-like transporter n=1 Tax=Mycolicibacterium chubuense (strain NBB4) TaxID=710421 RepID=I4BNJ6_MYCCN|nr:amino acid permease [Mycolicibacterium chubuense]AFM18853.1 gamma-aminobutyrate permease-like transporter [Mycolicibacterium chubuense NBB4]